MRCRSFIARAGSRRGAATVELALIVPLLAFLFVIGVDFARLFYYSLTLKNCARNGAYYASDYPGIYAYGSADQAATSDASNLSPQPSVNVAYDASATGTFSNTAPVRPGFVKVTVNWDFQTVTSYPGIASTWSLSQSEIMQLAPITPSNFP